MHHVARAVCAAAVSLAGLGLAAAAAQPSAARSGAVEVPVTTTLAPAATPRPTPTTAVTAAVIPRPVTTRPPGPPRVTPATSAPRPPAPTTASCGWAWDAQRADDGSSNELTVMLDAPGRPSEAVIITVKPGGSNTTTPARSQSTSTDDAGQASATFGLSNDKRDWTVTVSATFGSGAACKPQTFTLEY